jgi:hypothetical protein
MVLAAKKGPTVSVTKLEKGPDSVDEVESEVGVDDQLLMCAGKVLRAVKEDNRELLVEALKQIFEALEEVEHEEVEPEPEAE